MNREIKFRGLKNNSNKWVYGFYGILGKETDLEKHVIMESTLSNSSVANFYFTDIEIIPKSIGQFTGLHDKNGVEIYEGDILSKVSISELGGLIQYFYLVFWSSSDQGFETKQYVLDENDEGLYWRIKNEGIFDSLVMAKTYNHVIGNIHQNPEILK